jgi:hypothetical protein
MRGIDCPKDSDAMRFRSRLLQPREASEATLMKIRDVYMTPDGRVEGKEDDLVQTLERDAEALQMLRSPKS